MNDDLFDDDEFGSGSVIEGGNARLKTEQP